MTPCPQCCQVKIRGSGARGASWGGAEWIAVSKYDARPPLATAVRTDFLVQRSLRLNMVPLNLIVDSMSLMITSIS